MQVTLMRELPEGCFCSNCKISNIVTLEYDSDGESFPYPEKCYCTICNKEANAVD